MIHKIKTVLFLAVNIILLFGCASIKFSIEMATYNASKELHIISNADITIAVLSIYTLNENVNMQIITWLENHLVNLNKYRVVSRQRIDAVLLEQNFGLTGYISDDSAQSIGKLVGANYILVFDINYLNNKTYLNIQVLNTESATLVYSNSFRINLNESNVNVVKQRQFRF
jgi:uncharacterized lipoprotein YajG